MKKLLFLFTYHLILLSAISQNCFDYYFLQSSLRIDFICAGTKDSHEFILHQVWHEPFWGGPKKNTIDSFAYGSICFEMFDSASNVRIYRHYFSSLFDEWQTTAEATKEKRSFPISICTPFPLNTINIVISKRNKEERFTECYSTTINPNNYFIAHLGKQKYKTELLHRGGTPDTCLDVVFIAEGYTKKQMKKFHNDAKRISTYFLSVTPFDEYKNNINIHLVYAVSEEEGSDIPGVGIWKNTIVNSNFYTFRTERYITTADHFSLRSLAAHVPYDQIVLLVNTDKYGGGGIYNFFNVVISDDKHTPVIFVHELGHSFAGLADEYYTSEVAYQDFYNKAFEPWEPNITTLVNFSSKWQHLISPGTPIPTPDSAAYDNTIGVFEGAGYAEKGIYRPYRNCRMFSNNAPGFCPVCTDAIRKRLLFVIDK